MQQNLFSLQPPPPPPPLVETCCFWFCCRLRRHKPGDLILYLQLELFIEHLNVSDGLKSGDLDLQGQIGLESNFV